MSNPTPNFFESLGKPIKDEYGRSVGTVASFVVRPNGQVTEIFVEHGDGEIARYSSEQVKVNENEVTLFLHKAESRLSMQRNPADLAKRPSPKKLAGKEEDTHRTV